MRRASRSRGRDAFLFRTAGKAVVVGCYGWFPLRAIWSLPRERSWRSSSGDFCHEWCAFYFAFLSRRCGATCHGRSTGIMWQMEVRNGDVELEKGMSFVYVGMQSMIEPKHCL